MDKVCRLCLHPETNMTSIFYRKEGTSELRSQIQNLCSIEISENDALPKMICNSCTEKLSFVEQFRKQCKDSDSKLREHHKISASKLTYRSLQNVGVQTEDEVREKHSFLDIQTSRVSEEVGSDLLERVTSDADEGDDGKSDSVKNELGSTNDYNGSVNKEDIDPAKTGRAQRGTRTSLGRKILTTIRNKEKFMCHLCKKVYVSKKALLKHTEAHMKREIVMCEVCNKAFNNSNKLAEHSKKHSDVMDFKCEVCGMPFKEQVKLNFHLRVHGKGPPMNTDKQYLCDMCSRTFASKSGLRFHLKSHAGNKPYKCKFCNKSFTIPSYKKRHERTHTGDKHFMCHICNAGFASANGLKYHLRSHTGEANYHCSTCGKSFKRLKYLKEHTFTHTGERPFICKICGSAYGNSGSLFVHEKKCKTQYALDIIAASKSEENAVVQCN